MNRLETLIRKKARGTFFSCTFRKRTDGKIRRIVCRLDVNKRIKPATRGPSYNPAEKGLLAVYDVRNRGYRSIPLEGILELRIAGETYRGGALYRKPRETAGRYRESRGSQKLAP